MVLVQMFVINEFSSESLRYAFYLVNCASLRAMIKGGKTREKTIVRADLEISAFLDEVSNVNQTCLFSRHITVTNVFVLNLRIICTDATPDRGCLLWIIHQQERMVNSETKD